MEEPTPSDIDELVVTPAKQKSKNNIAFSSDTGESEPEAPPHRSKRQCIQEEAIVDNKEVEEVEEEIGPEDEDDAEEKVSNLYFQHYNNLLGP